MRCLVSTLLEDGLPPVLGDETERDEELEEGFM
jgi:hypothetical protein